MICSLDYKGYVAHNFFQEIFTVIRSDSNFEILDKTYIQARYGSEIKQLISRYDDMANVDKLTRTIKHSEEVLNNTKEVFRKVIIKNNRIYVY